jgi:LacI family transcriptional regulator
MSIAKVAQHAGVSTATVSRVLNEFPGVRKETAQQVWDAVQALQYDPQQVRRGPRPGMRRRPSVLARPRTGTIALMTVGHGRQHMQLPVMNAVVQAISRAAKEENVRLLLDEMPGVDEISPIVTHKEVDGVIVMLASDAPLSVLAKLNEYVPVVWVMSGDAGPLPIDHVAPDNVAIGYLAYQHLRGRGCKDIAYLTRYPGYRFMRHRAQAMASAAYEDGHNLRMFLVTDDQRLIETYGHNVVARPNLPELIDVLATAQPRPDGLFIAADAITVQVYPLLAQRGIEVERDLIILSCDNEDVRLSGLQPRPASIELGTEEIGRRAVRRLLLRQEDPTEPPLSIQAMPSIP